MGSIQAVAVIEGASRQTAMEGNNCMANYGVEFLLRSGI